MRVTFVMEQQIGHRTYSQNLRRVVLAEPDVTATWAPVTYAEPDGSIERLSFLPPGVRGALRGRQQVRASIESSAPDAVLFFTQVPAVLGGRFTRRHPYVIVLDDTPILYDQMSPHYGDTPDRFGPSRRFKKLVNERMLRNASFILPFSTWARASLVDDYGVDPARIEVIPSGVDTDEWQPGDPSRDGPMRILFVGGDFERKGGPTVLQALGALPEASYEFHVVTRSPVAASDNVFVYRDMEPNSDRLRALFRSAHVFVMPSVAEAFGHVVVEAAASGLPAIVSDAGGMPEIVEPGRTGFVVRAGDHQAIASHLRELLDDPNRAAQMGKAARARAEANYSAVTNGRRTVQRIRDAVANAS